MLATKERIIAQRSIAAESYILSTLPALYLPLWKRDSGGTNQFLSDDGAGYQCTVTGALWTPQGRKLNGTTDYISLGDILDSTIAGADKQFSILAWVKPGVNNMTNNTIVGKYLTTGNQRAFLFRLSTDSKTHFFWTALEGVIYRGVLGSTPITDTSKWYHILFTYDGSLDTNDGLDRVKMWVDDVVETTTLDLTNGSLLNIVDSTAHLTIGATTDTSGLNPTGLWNGSIGEIVLYPRLLTAIGGQQHRLATRWRYQ